MTDVHHLRPDTVPGRVVDDIAAVIDRVKTDETNLDTDAYVGMILDALTPRPEVVTKTIGRDTTRGDYLEITVVQRDPCGEPFPGFSLTSCLWSPRADHSGRTRKKRGQDADANGCLHADVRLVAPWLQPVIDVHLADADGVPRHAKVGGWHLYSGRAAAEERQRIAAGRGRTCAHNLRISDHERAAQALHITPADLPTGIATEAEFHAFVDGLTDTYEQRAAVARSVIEQMVDGEGVQIVEDLWS